MTDADAAYRSRGGARLEGAITVSGAKNAAMPCMAAALLTDEPCVIENVPEIGDVLLFAEIRAALGADVEFAPGMHCAEVRIGAVANLGHVPPDRLVANQRASFLVMGPLLARLGHAACGAPGGDVIGQRPLDVHLTGFIALGADVGREGGRMVATAPRGLAGDRVVLDYPSVLGTENLLLAAVLAGGRTEIVNAAAEPEVVCLAQMLLAMGAKIEGAGTHTIRVDGVDRLSGVVHELIPDRIETGTLAVAAAVTRGDVTLSGAQPRHVDALLAKLGAAGVEIEEGPTELVIRGAPALEATNVQAVPYPGLATDLQALMTTLLTQANGVSVIHERVFENRLQYVGELRKLGASIVTAGTTAIVQGPAPLHGSTVHGLDVRAAAALIVAGLAAEGETELLGIDHLERGYEHLDVKLRDLGADVSRLDLAPVG